MDQGGNGQTVDSATGANARAQRQNRDKRRQEEEEEEDRRDRQTDGWTDRQADRQLSDEARENREEFDIPMATGSPRDTVGDERFWGVVGGVW